jgi:hypothetical protein
MEEKDMVNPAWRSILLKKKQVNLSFLPAKILMGRWQNSLTENTSDDTMKNAIKEVFDLYLKYKDLPNAKKDIAVILNK